MRSRLGWGLVALLGTCGCFGSSNGNGSGNGGGTTLAPKASSVNVINCSNYNISVWSRAGLNGNWKHHGFTGTGKLTPNGACNLNVAGVLNANINTGGHTVRVVYEDNCDAGQPNGACLKEDRPFDGDNSAPIRDFKVTKL